MPIKYMTDYYGAQLVEEYPDGSNEPFCCEDYEQLIELSNGYVDGNSWDTVWDISGFIETRREIKEHRCNI